MRRMIKPRPEPAIEASSLPPEAAYSLVQVAEILGVSVFTARRLGTTGELKVLKVSPRRVIVRPADLRAFLDSRDTTSAQ